MPQTTKKVLLLLMPSWASCLTTIIAAIIIIAANYFKSRSDIGALTEGIQGFQSIFGPIYHRLTDSLARNSIASNLPLLLFWAVVGAAVYVLAVRLFTAFSKTAALEQTLFYSNVKRDSFIRSLIIGYALRLVALFSWFVYCSVFFKSILPSVTVAAQSGGLLVATIGLIIALHLHIIFARLTMLRLRVFSDGIVS